MSFFLVGIHVRNKKLLIVFAAISLFTALVVGVFFLVRSGTINPEVGLLMLICLLGLYVGFGILIAVYRLVQKLE